MSRWVPSIAAALVALTSCTASPPTQPVADEGSVPCGENVVIAARTTKEGDYLALVYDRDSPPRDPRGVFLVSKGAELLPISLKTVKVYADGGSIDVTLGNGSTAMLGGGYASTEAAQKGEPIGQLKSGFASLDLYPADDAQAQEFLQKKCGE